ncbi:hypothetical protein Q5M85_21850 [Paraclostridium bifermentans]|nr:hypothetical protein [Paraclostridium bifermentans]
MVGDYEQEVKRVMVCLEANEKL